LPSYCIEVRWKSGSAKGFTDLLAVDDFATDAMDRFLMHTVRGPKGGEHYARCRVTVTDRVASMDYNAYPAFNLARGMDVGVMEFQFKDPSRQAVAKILWNGRPVPAREAEVATVRTRRPATIDDAIVRGRAKYARTLLRQHQSRFRRKIGIMYDERCCLSGCSAPWALDAAHIRPYRDGRINALANGLLLSADLHALFDFGHLAIDPQDGIAWFSRDARDSREYLELHGVARLARPARDWETNAAPLSAFRARWERFCREHSDAVGRAS
jgi:hypothetical protein